MKQLTQLLNLLRLYRGVLVKVVRTQGSVPRDSGSWMAVFKHTLVGTIGGGHLEFQAVALAKDALEGRAALPGLQTVPLGPALGQCCGGVVQLEYRLVSGSDSESLREELRPALQPVALFGGGHVGRALVRVLSDLPFALRWIDSRDEVFPSTLPEQVIAEHSDPVHAAVADLVPGSKVLIMSFSHAEDLDILAACLTRLRTSADLPYVGLIGSDSKWARFRHRLEARGFGAQDFAHVTTPIGMSGIESKLPEVIAVSVAAQLLQMSQ
ncbi:MAG: xanthine dehydrogenase accessory protein XdhC [Limnohabitans sp.]